MSVIPVLERRRQEGTGACRPASLAESRFSEKLCLKAQDGEWVRERERKIPSVAFWTPPCIPVPSNMCIHMRTSHTHNFWRMRQPGFQKQEAQSLTRHSVKFYTAWGQGKTMKSFYKTNCLECEDLVSYQWHDSDCMQSINTFFPKSLLPHIKSHTWMSLILILIILRLLNSNDREEN